MIIRLMWEHRNDHVPMKIHKMCDIFPYLWWNNIHISFFLSSFLYSRVMHTMFNHILCWFSAVPGGSIPFSWGKITRTCLIVPLFDEWSKSDWVEWFSRKRNIYTYADKLQFNLIARIPAMDVSHSSLFLLSSMCVVRQAMWWTLDNMCARARPRADEIKCSLLLNCNYTSQHSVSACPCLMNIKQSTVCCFCWCQRRWRRE